jgi:hypothetical protein
LFRFHNNLIIANKKCPKGTFTKTDFQEIHMASTYKAQVILTELVDLLTQELKTPLPVITQGVDTSSNPYAIFSATSTLTTGNAVAVLQVVALPVTSLNTDILGNAANKYGPHVIRLITEANSAYATGGSGATPTELALTDILSPTSLLPILIELGRTGCAIEWYQTANGTAVPVTRADIAALTGTTLTASWKPLFWNYQSAT